jgi:sterol desaturase/sphingolipid hydroxylase (fatty acid hydroxylase superfamily)
MSKTTPDPQRKPAPLAPGDKTHVLVPVLAASAALGIALLHPAMGLQLDGWMIGQFVAEEIAGYLIWACGFFALFWVVLHGLLRKRQVSRRRWPRLTQVGREILFSLSSQFIFIAVAVWLAFSDGWGLGNMYTGMGDYGYWWLGATVFLVLVIDDTWFYWSHRAMHHPVLFERVHRVHHESVDPTPFTAFSFHPLEAMVHGVGSLSLLLFTVFLPWHPAAIALTGTLQMLFNVVGHLGYEVYPRGWNRVPVLRWKTPTLHHYMHHQRVGGNYGLYFRWWDKICGTEFKDFEARYDRLFETAPVAGRPDLDGRI